MKAKNSKTVAIGYLFFVITLFCSIFVAVGCVYSFVVTSKKEIAHIEKRSLEYDAAFERQVMITEEVDLLYQNIKLLNSDQRINELLLQNRISNKKMNFINTIDKLDVGEVLLYKKMSTNVNDILAIKDSIRILHAQVEQTKVELQRCIQDNRVATRKMIFTNP